MPCVPAGIPLLIFTDSKHSILQDSSIKRADFTDNAGILQFAQPESDIEKTDGLPGATMAHMARKMPIASLPVFYGLQKIPAGVAQCCVDKPGWVPVQHGTGFSDIDL